MREMKDSGIEWIGEIPKDWEVCKLRILGDFTASGIDKKINEKEVNVRIINYVDVYRNKNFLLQEKEYMTVTTTPEKATDHQILEGDLIFTPSSETVEDIGVSALVDEFLPNTCFSYHVLRFQFKKNVVKNYKKYLCNNQYVLNYFSKKASGSIRKTLNREDFKETKVILPPLPTQQRIADYLDKQCAEIDAVVEKTKATIEDYKNYKYALIADAITKGIDNNVETKESTVNWIGVVPKHWNIYKLKFLFSINKDIAGELGHDVLSVTQTGLKIKDLSNNGGQMASDYSKYQIVKPGNFVMNHMDLLTGWVDYSIYNGVTSPDYRVFKLDRKDLCNNFYYTYLFQLCYKHRIFYNLGQGVSNLGRWRLQADKFLNFQIPLPPLEEQEEIALYLDEKCSAIDTIIEKKQTIISELESYKKSLIYECVTGKKEV